jgi:hypothetical protein
MLLPRLLVLVCAGAVVAADPATPFPKADTADRTVSTALAVQTALQQGREYLLHGEYRAAVSTLEGQLPFINGSKVYLKALEDAYRGYIKELRLAKQHEDAQRYLERLLYLDKGALLDKSLTGGNAVAAAERVITKSADSYAVKTTPTVRAKSLDENAQTARISERPAIKDVSVLLARAEQEFNAKHFRESRLLYDQVAQADQKSISADIAHKERWAYCKLFSVVEQVNQSGPQKPSWPELEEEVRVALSLAPRLEKYGKDLLEQMREAAVETPASGPADSAVAVRHADRNAQGWLLAESPNFRIFHKQSAELAEQAAQSAERARAQVLQKWFGSGDSWSLKCDLYIHPTADDYSHETGKYNSPGHSTIRIENGRMVVRRIDVHADDPSMLPAVLPHETTHVVLAGAFGERLVPRWVDEGVAVLSEPRQKVQRHLDNLERCRQSNELFHLKDLMQLDDYPRNPRYVGAFYAQSVSLVEFLANQKGAQEFTLFLHDSMRYGEEKALQRHYGYQSFTELEQQWFQTAFRDQTAASRLP